MDQSVYVTDPLQVLLLLGGGKKAIKISVRHQRLLQLPQILFHRACDCLAFQYVQELVVAEERQPLCFSLFGVEAHLQNFVDLCAHAADAVESFLLEAARFQAFDALLHEGEADVVDAVLFLLHGIAFAGRQINRLLTIHCVQPRLPILLGKGLERVYYIWLLLERQIEAESLLEV